MGEKPSHPVATGPVTPAGAPDPGGPGRRGANPWGISPRPCPMVELRHELPGGSHHFDWLLGRDPAGESPLVSFRLERPLRELLEALSEGQTADAQQIQDHRPKYLTYEGPISADRGHVRRVASGTVHHVEVLDQRGGVVLQIIWHGPGGGQQRQRVALEPRRDGRWSVREFDASTTESDAEAGSQWPAAEGR